MKRMTGNINNLQILRAFATGTRISLGIVHALKNTGKKWLELIEAQSDSYLGESDIERLLSSTGVINH